jgi:phosphotransacetylase
VTVLGNVDAVKQLAAQLQVDLSRCNIIDPANAPDHAEMAEALFECRKAKGMTIEKANDLVMDGNYYGTMMMFRGMADGMVSGACHTTADTMRPALQVY